MCSSESRIILNSFQSVFEYFADASFVCRGLCLLLRYASAIWSFLPFCTKQCKKWRPILAACWGLSAQSCSTASWATVWRLKSSCSLSCWRYIQFWKLEVVYVWLWCLLSALNRWLGSSWGPVLAVRQKLSSTISFLGGVIKRPQQYDVSYSLKNCFLCFHTSKLRRATSHFDRILFAESILDQ